ncbi:SAM-dependent methyltransferase [Cohnella lubricantis]|uniref:SAM-dependent methyltransferase n=1 Tax=Cohnella lubricantis TaxID=2163172 RepID=A0A841THN2_9BACL|nr:SAM-dependent methyltransferase [Cohnella lubricantis]MBB6677971.1 SAM-dependent methyltransferase [Cohnella lubricantis]MBP2119961.1 SAM-dependent methyltransferase [Cohnella lubricantis]
MNDAIPDKKREELQAFLQETIQSEQLLQATLSQPRSKSAEAARRISVRPVRLKNTLHYQFERLVGNKALHDNLTPEQAAGEMERLLSEDYRQALIKTPEADVQVLVSKKGKPALLRQAPTSKQADSAAAAQAHNRTKPYALPEGEPVPFLIELGVMTPEGRVVKAKYDKFRQINRFLEMVADTLPQLPADREIRIVDFGCGKSYLTFALYHWLAIRERRNVTIFGLDLKKDVIETCSRLAAKLGWDKLRFAVGDISKYKESAEVDMVVTLHACDTATDAALLQAIEWQANVILSVPCCQHELFSQLSQPMLKPLLKHGLLKERFSALVTDAVRAQLLETAGYRTQLLEFIDLEHTPKNILIRAVRTGQQGSCEAASEYAAMRDFLGISPYMERNSQGELATILSNFNNSERER